MINWGWVVFIAALIQNTIVAGIILGVNEVLAFLQEQGGYDIEKLGAIGATTASLSMLLCPLVSSLYGQFGARCLTIIGVVVFSLGILLTYWGTNFLFIFFSYGIVAGLGASLTIHPIYFLLNEYFPYDHPRHVLTTGSMTCVYPIATLTFNPVTYTLLQETGWRNTYLTYAILMFVVGVITSLTYRPVTGDKQLTQEKAEPVIMMTTSFSRRIIILMSVLWFLASLCKTYAYYGTILFLVTHMVSLGIAQYDASLAMTIMGVAELISRAGTSFLGDRFKGWFLCIYAVFAFLLSLLNIAGAFITSLTAITLFGLALGLLGGPIISAMYSSCSEILENQYVREYFSIFRMAMGLGTFFGPVAAVFIFNSTGSFSIAFLNNSACYFTTSLLYTVIILLDKYRPTCVYPASKEYTDLTEENGVYEEQLAVESLKEFKNILQQHE